MTVQTLMRGLCRIVSWRSGLPPPLSWDRNAYLIWEAGKPPDFVAEVASESTASNDLGHKRDLYARLGIQEYWRFDATGGSLYGSPLVGERLVDGEYQRYELHTDADGDIWAHSALLDLDFRWMGRGYVSCARLRKRRGHEDA